MVAGHLDIIIIILIIIVSLFVVVTIIVIGGNCHQFTIPDTLPRLLNTFHQMVYADQCIHGKTISIMSRRRISNDTPVYPLLLTPLELTIHVTIIDTIMFITYITNLLLREVHVPYKEITSPTTALDHWDVPVPTGVPPTPSIPKCMHLEEI